MQDKWFGLLMCVLIWVPGLIAWAYAVYCDKELERRLKRERLDKGNN